MSRLLPLVVVVGLSVAGCHTGRADTPIAMLGERKPPAAAPAPTTPSTPAPVALPTWRAEYYEIGPG